MQQGKRERGGEEGERRMLFLRYTACRGNFEGIDQPAEARGRSAREKV
jgi:hypothetical protein